MWKSKLLILGCLSSITGCFKTYLGPISDPIANGTGGYWKLTSVILKGKLAPTYFAAGKELLAVSYKDTTRRTTETEYRIFAFYNSAIIRTNSVEAERSGVDQNKKKTKETVWFEIDGGSGFRVIMDCSNRTGQSSRMEMSNVINKGFYDTAGDTIRYLFEPTVKFK